MKVSIRICHLKSSAISSTTIKATEPPKKKPHFWTGAKNSKRRSKSTLFQSQTSSKTKWKRSQVNSANNLMILEMRFMKSKKCRLSLKQEKTSTFTSRDGTSRTRPISSSNRKQNQDAKTENDAENADSSITKPKNAEERQPENATSARKLGI